MTGILTIGRLVIKSTSGVKYGDSFELADKYDFLVVIAYPILLCRLYVSKRVPHSFSKVTFPSAYFTTLAPSTFISYFKAFSAKNSFSSRGV